MEAGRPKPFAGSVHDSPTPQGVTLLLGLKLFNPLLHRLAHATGGAVNFLVGRPPARRQAAIGAVALFR